MCGLPDLGADLPRFGALPASTLALHHISTEALRDELARRGDEETNAAPLPLNDYMREQRLTNGEMAALVGGISPHGIRKLRYRERGPSIQVAARIEAITGGRVRAADLQPFRSELDEQPSIDATPPSGPSQAIIEAIAIAGSETKLGVACGFSQTAIWKAKRTGNVSAYMAKGIERATAGRITAARLCPKVFAPFDLLPAATSDADRRMSEARS